jgi:hypothetical protein
MEIIDKSAKPPIFIWEGKPSIFKTKLEEVRWWEEEKRRWLEGYNGISGLMYFYCTQVKLKNRVTGEIGLPIARDAELLIFDAIDEARKKGKGLFINKGRGIGLSSVMFGISFYFYKIYPNSKVIATSKDKTTLATLFSDKVVTALDYMDKAIKPDIINKNETATSAYLKMGFKFKTQDGHEDYGISELLCRDTAESEKAASAFSGTGAIYGAFDELPLNPRRNKLLQSSKDCFIDQVTGRTTGFLLTGGTIEDTLTPTDIASIRDLVQGSKYIGLDYLFIPSTYGKYMTNGHSDHEKAREEILRQREEYEKLDDKSFYNAYVKNQPLSIEEIFELSGSSSWDDYALNNINKRASEIPKEKLSIGTFKMNDLGHKVEVTPSVNGKVKILEHPKKGVKYIIGVDGIMTSELTSSSKDASDFAACGMKGVDPQSDLQFAPVFLYKERPKSIEDANRTTLDLLRYYNEYGNAKLFTETNAAGEHLLKMIQNAGLWECVGFRKDLNKRGWVDTKKAGFHRTDSIKDWQYEAANVYFKKYSEMIKFLEIITDAQKPYEANKDTLDSFMACLYGWGTGDLLNEKMIQKKVITMSVCEWDAVANKYIWVEKHFEG